jgi:selenocysteine-specific elongation factor
MRVIGTAGHVDHGKSTLVRALSGIDPDRLKEEKARGMTIDLGFAWLELPIPNQSQPESVGIVDVPGHVDFIKNMLAGVGGLDAVVLVIAADEGVMPQTREHLAILDLLAMPAAVVALTKIDLVQDAEWLELVELDIVDLLESTRLAGAPIVRVSAATGVGLLELRKTIGAALGKLPARRNRARPRLPIDRVFSLSGFGTVVTGTLQDGDFSVGDAVEILPAGLPARIRSLQTHKRQVTVGRPGSRLAINLTNVSLDQVMRGDVVVKPGTVQPTSLIDVRFRLLADAHKALEHNQRVDFFSGATETPAHVRLLGDERLQPGQAGWLQLRLESPVVVAAGDRYILRQPSPSQTLGGGDVLSPHPRRRWPRHNAAVLQRLAVLAQGAPDEILLHTLQRLPFCTVKQLFSASDLDLTVAEEAFAELRASGALLSVDTGGEAALCTLNTWQKAAAEVNQLLQEFHRLYPLRRGMARSEVRGRLQSALGLNALPVRLFNALVERLQQEGALQADDASVWQADFTIALTVEQQQLVDHLLAAFAAAPFAPPNQAESLRLLGQQGELLEMLIEQGRLVRLGDGVLFRHQDFATMLDLILGHLRQNGAVTLAEVRDLLQTSRKYAQAVLEEMDARRLTRREGEARVLR